MLTKHLILAGGDKKTRNENAYKIIHCFPAKFSTVLPKIISTVYLKRFPTLPYLKAILITDVEGEGEILSLTTTLEYFLEDCCIIFTTACNCTELLKDDRFNIINFS